MTLKTNTELEELPPFKEIIEKRSYKAINTKKFFNYLKDYFEAHSKVTYSNEIGSMIDTEMKFYSEGDRRTLIFQIDHDSPNSVKVSSILPECNITEGLFVEKVDEIENIQVVYRFHKLITIEDEIVNNCVRLKSKEFFNNEFFQVMAEFLNNK